MPPKSSRQYYAELADLLSEGLSGSSRAVKILNILGERGFDTAEIDLNLSQGIGELPDKYSTGGLVRPRGYGKARYKRK